MSAESGVVRGRYLWSSAKGIQALGADVTGRGGDAVTKLC